jgi:hypothetical protein
MLAQLGTVIDQVYDAKKRTGRSAKKKIVFLVGSGILHISNILNDDQIISEVAKRSRISKNPTSRSFQEFRWRLFEYARYYTANTLPTLAHACIYQMITDGVCRDVITTNYDLFFDSIWEKYPKLNIKKNPVCTTGEHNWDNYYSCRRTLRGNARYWKIHGSLSHVVFRGKSLTAPYQIHQLPRFAISTNQPDLANKFGGETLAPFMGYEERQYPKTQFALPSSLNPQYEPFIDWTYGSKRACFEREIRAASHVLKDKQSVAAIVIIGFRGYFDEKNPRNPWNEELVPVINKLIDDGNIPIFMALHRQQYNEINEPTSKLPKRLDSSGCCYVYDDVGAFITELVNRPNCKHFPFATCFNEYGIWMNHWFMVEGERVHA